MSRRCGGCWLPACTSAHELMRQHINTGPAKSYRTLRCNSGLPRRCTVDLQPVLSMTQMSANGLRLPAFGPVHACTVSEMIIIKARGCQSLAAKAPAATAVGLASSMTNTYFEDVRIPVQQQSHHLTSQHLAAKDVVSKLARIADEQRLNGQIRCLLRHWVASHTLARHSQRTERLKTSS